MRAMLTVFSMLIADQTTERRCHTLSASAAPTVVIILLPCVLPMIKGSNGISTSNRSTLTALSVGHVCHSLSQRVHSLCVIV